MSGSGVSPAGVTVVSASQITATFVISATALTGARNVTVTTGAGTSAPAVFTVLAPPKPTLASLAPNSAAAEIEENAAAERIAASPRLRPMGIETTSTVSGSGDQGADPNKLVSITDQPGAPAPAPGESFQTVQAAGYGQVLRGVSFTPGTGASGH